MKIVCYLKEIMAARGMKHGWLADKVEISQTTMSALINGRQLPTMPVAYRIAKELDLNVMEIWREVESE